MNQYKAQLQALLNGTVERFFNQKYFSFLIEGSEVPLTPDDRAYIEGALSCTLEENSIAGGKLCVLEIPVSARAKAERYLKLACA